MKEELVTMEIMTNDSTVLICKISEKNLMLLTEIAELMSDRDVIEDVL